jgi:hypothetical protein
MVILLNEIQHDWPAKIPSAEDYAEGLLREYVSK